LTGGASISRVGVAKHRRAQSNREMPNESRGNSEKWPAMRNALHSLHFRCQGCGRKASKKAKKPLKRSLHAHHLIYRSDEPRGLTEEPGDLVMLCFGCHKGIHRRFGYELDTQELLEQQLEWIANLEQAKKAARKAKIKKRKEAKLRPVGLVPAKPVLSSTGRRRETTKRPTT